MTADVAIDELNISSVEFWRRTNRARDEVFSVLRRERPVSYHAPMSFGLAGMAAPMIPGFWAITSYDAVRTVSRNPEVFCSGAGALLDDIALPQDMREQVGSFLVMDGQRHSSLRRMVSRAFTPKQLARVESQIADQAKRVVDHLLEVGDCDFVQEVSTPMPLWTISEMVGIPEEDRAELVAAANALFASSDPGFLDDGMDAFTRFLEATQQIWQSAVDLADARRRAPQDDLMSALVEAEVDGETLTDGEIGAFMLLLMSAGTDTTRTTINHTMKAFCDHPDQRQLLLTDLDAGLPTAVEEFLRWATPIIHMRRTATHDTDLGGQSIRAGDHLVMFYESANHDEGVFDDPWRFDVARQPNDHLAFGGGGPHHCLGAHLARTQLRCVFRELLLRAPNLQVGPPEYLTSYFTNGITTMPCTL